MIVFYNETKKAWKVDKINDSLNRIGTTKHTKNNTSYIGIGVTSANKIDDVSSYISMDNSVVISKEDTDIGFRSTDLKPWVKTKNKYLYDVIIIDIYLNGGRVVDISGMNILNWRIINNQLVIIGSPRYIKGIAASPVITLYDKTNNKVTKYTFNARANYNLTKETQDSGDTKFNEYRFQIFRKNKPTKLIFVYQDDLEDFNKLNITGDRNEIIVIDQDGKNIESSIDDMVRKKYKAATIFVNSEYTTDTNYDNVLFKSVVDSFRTINLLYNNGKVALYN